MNVHLLRHADAEDSATSDAERVLTKRGELQSIHVAEFLVRTQQPLDLILTSPYLRALQTANAVAEKLGTPLIQERRLSCGMSPQTGYALLQEHRQLENVLLVGHQPDLSIFAAFLLTQNRSLDVEFGKAALMSIALNPLAPGSGLLLSFIDESQMG